jgi:hypothetical protein
MYQLEIQTVPVLCFNAQRYIFWLYKQNRNGLKIVMGKRKRMWLTNSFINEENPIFVLF